jgi:hypothetical protein
MTDRDPDPLDVLRVVDRLVVGPVQVERRRIVAPYVVQQGDRCATFKLIYRYEEDVFDPHDGASRNLAAMIAGQVALNYGLFCDEIVFHDLGDPADRQFLREMAKNTAREIFVNKLLEPNRFLTGQVRELPPIRRDSYLLARLVFPDATSASASGGTWWTDPSRVCVLSSGGKDSLLSHALLAELKQQVHPIFVNESGRHWFTALNAYRHFAVHVANTARVWTNSDRLFSWMLRHLPFVRADFARLRADKSPSRLWTVAVFLFGTLPLLKKRGVGRLVIGDEYDTTDRRIHAGLAHNNGVYDQSRYFDRYLTRYFQLKGWNVTQFSMLRSLSELLIEKVLVERYPQMQRLQVSCHAAHAVGRASDLHPVQGDSLDEDGLTSTRHVAGTPVDSNDFRPCGNCEKCTRIVAMLKALGADPSQCGYSQQQIDRALNNLVRRGVMQESGAVEQLAFLLQRRGLLPAAEGGAARVREHPEIMKLRFDPERSRIDDIPVDLRRPVYSILLQHAAGAAHRVGRRWTEFDVMNDPLLAEANRPP